VFVVLFLLRYGVIPESPRRLAADGQLDRAAAIAERIVARAYRGRELPAEPVGEEPVNERRTPLRELLAQPLLARMLLITAFWFAGYLLLISGWGAGVLVLANLPFTFAVGNIVRQAFTYTAEIFPTRALRRPPRQGDGVGQLPVLVSFGATWAMWSLARARSVISSSRRSPEGGRNVGHPVDAVALRDPLRDPTEPRPRLPLRPRRPRAGRARRGGLTGLEDLLRDVAELGRRCAQSSLSPSGRPRLRR
jgi:hypothetical protein